MFQIDGFMAHMGIRVRSGRASFTIVSCDVTRIHFDTFTQAGLANLIADITEPHRQVVKEPIETCNCTVYEDNRLGS